MDDLLDLFGSVANGFKERLQRLPALEVLHLAPFPARLLSLVGRHPGCSQAELASWTGRDKAQIARAIKDLEKRGLVGREAHESDWRAHSVRLLASGQEAFVLLDRERTLAGAELLATLSAAERAVLRSALSKMRSQLNASQGSVHKA